MGWTDYLLWRMGEVSELAGYEKNCSNHLMCLLIIVHLPLSFINELTTAGCLQKGL